MLGLIVLFAAAFSVHGQTTTVSRCNRASSGALPINTYIHGCTTPPCILPQGQDVVLDIVFEAPRSMENMRTLATAYLNTGLFDVPVPYPLGANGVTCNFLTNSYCPLVKGEIVQYQLRMFIEEAFRVDTQATIEFRVEETAPESQAVFCVRVPIRIAPPVPSNQAMNAEDKLLLRRQFSSKIHKF